MAGWCCRVTEGLRQASISISTQQSTDCPHQLVISLARLQPKSNVRARNGRLPPTTACLREPIIPPIQLSTRDLHMHHHALKINSATEFAAQPVVPDISRCRLRGQGMSISTCFKCSRAAQLQRCSSQSTLSLEPYRMQENFPSPDLPLPWSVITVPQLLVCTVHTDPG